VMEAVRHRRDDGRPRRHGHEAPLRDSWTLADNGTSSRRTPSAARDLDELKDFEADASSCRSARTISSAGARLLGARVAKSLRFIAHPRTGRPCSRRWSTTSPARSGTSSRPPTSSLEAAPAALVRREAKRADAVITNSCIERHGQVSSGEPLRLQGPDREGRDLQWYGCQTMPRGVHRQRHLHHRLLQPQFALPFARRRGAVLFETRPSPGS
jgi:hypothetical protein